MRDRADDLGARAALRILGGVLAVQAALHLLLPLSGSAWSWMVFSPLHAEVAADLLPGGASPWDAYDGLFFGPLLTGLLEALPLAVLGRTPLVHISVSLSLALAATLLAFALVRRMDCRRSALAAAILVAFPPPITWYTQQPVAYHLMATLTLPAGLLLLGAPGREAGATPAPLWRRLAGWTLLAVTPVLTPPAIAVAAPLGLWWLWLESRPLLLAGRRRRPLAEVLVAVAGALLAFSPVFYKAVLHDTYGGGVPAGGLSAAGKTKPLFLDPPGLSEIPGRLLDLAVVQVQFGLNFGLHGVGRAGPIYVVLAAAALAFLVWRAWRGERGEWLGLLAVPPAVLAMGVLTGWFVFHRGGDVVTFPREARHVIGLAWTMALLLGLALARLPRVAVPAGWVLILVLASASAWTQVAEIPWERLPPDRWQTSWRLQGRMLQGFFAGPSLREAPRVLAEYCSEHGEPMRTDCLRGAAMSLGIPEAAPAFASRGHDVSSMRAACAGLSEASFGSVGLEGCFRGLGFGLAHLAFRAPRPAIAACGRLAGTSQAERLVCVEGVAWGIAQDFWNRPEGMRGWLAREVPQGFEVAWARGVGDLLGRLSSDPEWWSWQCRELVGGELAGICGEAAARWPSPPSTLGPTLPP